MRTFVFPTAVAVAVCAAAFLFGGVHALFIVALLAILETTLSFDNAVVNARVLARMDALWQKRFLDWGIPLAVFGTRFVLPILIVAAAAGLSPVLVVSLALFDPVRYGEYLSSAHVAIDAFGSAFLFLVSLKFFLNEQKTVHWIVIVEERLARWGGIQALEIVITATILVASALLFPEEAITILVAGCIGVAIFVVLEMLSRPFELDSTLVIRGGMALFVYLNVLDAAFSLDGVVAAFAITSNLPLIIAGLGIGALYVRAATVALVKARTLETLRYIEHGAHWAILGLGFSMLASIFMHVPEILTGLIGLVFIGFSYLSSRRALPKLSRPS